jgi:CubicO group peptidase (beta-lactamase class C family)
MSMPKRPLQAAVVLLSCLAAGCATTDPGSDTACAPVNVDLAAAKDNSAVNKITGHIDTTMHDLIEDNADMSLDDPIGEHLAGFALPSGWEAITIRQLLAHTSGIAKDPTSIDSEASLIAAFPNAGPHPGIHPRYAFESYKDNMPADLSFQPNATARYSNIGYSLLGVMIDKRASQGLAADASGYERYVYENVALNQNKLTEPAMTSLCLGTSWRAPHIKNLASSNPDPPKSPGDVFSGNGWEGPSGGWTMTVGDLGRLMIIINSNKRLDPATTDEMMLGQGEDTPFHMDEEAGDDTVAQYALGVAVEPDASSRDFFAKGGDIVGYTSNFKYHRDADVGAGILCSKESIPHLQITNAIDAILEPCLENSPPAFCSPIGGITGGG